MNLSTPHPDQARRVALPLLLAASVITFVALALISAFGVAYVAQPDCAKCHSADTGFAKATQSSGHSMTACTQCHGQSGVSARARFAGRQVFGMWIKASSASGRYSSAVPREACLRCHAGVLDAPVEASGYRIAHKSCSQGRQCTDCHSGTAHGAEVKWVREADMQDCLSCHEEEGAPVECDTCHQGRDTKERLQQGVWRVTHGPNWKTAHGMGDTKTCQSCHPTDYCDRCHGAGVPHDTEFLSAHGDVAKTSVAKCDSCHKQDFCTSCHGVVMPHPKTFTKDHTKIAKNTADPSCMKCHAVRDCIDCHTYHAHPGGQGPKGQSVITQGAD